ncbi:MAG: hypothetical protein PHF46_04420 [Candidatus Gracilibacteria bacterium]|nr:hypothetical protein [Candidatus Gracilibacteria bacterium]MDD3120626.1 hypothetical protein [Candidatus Gracilibacteria bacterium]MDD4529970.1 hypothetical protein [Candidatus Gracilibacteria bacterium]
MAGEIKKAQEIQEEYNTIKEAINDPTKLLTDLAKKSSDSVDKTGEKYVIEADTKKGTSDLGTETLSNLKDSAESLEVSSLSGKQIFQEASALVKTDIQKNIQEIKDEKDPTKKISQISTFISSFGQSIGKFWKGTENALGAIFSGKGIAGAKLAFLETFSSLKKGVDNNVTETTKVGEDKLKTSLDGFKNNLKLMLKGKGISDTKIDEIYTKNEAKLREYYTNNSKDVSLPGALEYIGLDKLSADIPGIKELISENTKDFKKELKSMIIKKFNIKVEPGDETDKKLDGLAEKYKNYYVGNFEDLSNEYKNGKAVTLGELISMNAGGMVMLMADLFVAVPKLDICVGFAENVWDSQKKLLKVCSGAMESTFFGGANNELISFTQEEFGMATENMSAEQKNAMVAMLYRQGGLFFSLMANLGYATGKMIQTSVSLGADLSGTRLAALNMTGKYKEIAQTFDEMVKKLGLDSDMTARLGVVIEETANETRLMSLYKNYSGGDLEEFKKTIANEDFSGVNAERFKKNALEDIESVMKEGNVQELKKQLGIKFSNRINTTTGQMTIWDEFKAYLKNSTVGALFDKSNYVVDSAIHDVNKYRAINSDIFRSGWKPLEIFKGFSNTFKISKIPGSANRTSIYCTEGDLPKIKRVLNESPEIFRGLVGGLPIIMVAGIVMSSKTEENDSKAKTMAEGLLGLTRIVGPYTLLTSAGVQNGELKNIESAVFGAGFLVYDACSLFKIVSTAGTLKQGALETLKFVGEPIIEAGNFVKSTIQLMKGLKDGGKELISLLREGKMVEARGLLLETGIAKGPALLGLFAVALAIFVGYKYFFEKSPEQIMADWQNEGIIDGNGGLVCEKATKLPDSEKETLMEMAYCSRIFSNSQTGVIADENYKVQVPEVKVKITGGKASVVRLNSIIDTFTEDSMVDFAKKIGIEDVSFTYNKEGMAEYVKKLKTQNISEENIISLFRTAKFADKDIGIILGLAK